MRNKWWHPKCKDLLLYGMGYSRQQVAIWNQKNASGIKLIFSLNTINGATSNDQLFNA